MCSTYSTNSSQVLDQSKNAFHSMDSKGEQQQNQLVVSYNPCKQFTNAYKTSAKDSPKTMAGNLKCDYPNNLRRPECLEYYPEDKIEEVTSHLHDVVKKLQNLNVPKDVNKLEVNDSGPQVNKEDMDDTHERQDNNIMNSEGEATACGADVVDFPRTFLDPVDSDELSMNCEKSHFLKQFLKPTKNRSPIKSPKHRKQWHKANEQFSNYDADIEIAEEAYAVLPDLYFPHTSCTLNEFITIHEDTTSVPINREHVKFESISYTISPPKRIPKLGVYMKPVKKVSTTKVYCDNDFVFMEQEESYSVSPPSRGSFVRKRLPSVTSEDSFVVFGDGGDSDNSDETESDISDEEDTSSDEDECSSSEDDSTLSSVHSDPLMLNVNSGQRKVRFADEENLEEVHVIIAWDFAYRACRKGHWEECVRDRERFRLRTVRAGNCLEKIFDPEHRDRIYKERFSDDVTRFD